MSFNNLKKYFGLIAVVFISASGLNAEYNQLTRSEEYVLLRKGTERPGTGDLLKNKDKGTYICAQCNAPLYRSEDKFESHCGWPSFDDEIEGSVRRETDKDGRRVEILCENCGGHLGHVFKNEGFTKKNTRHCVNSVSMNFIPSDEALPAVIVLGQKPELAKAVFAGGCFWGMEYWFEKQEGVESVVSGMALSKKMVESDTVEAIEVTYDPSLVDFQTLAELFFEIHDPTQVNQQGADIGREYRSVAFYSTQQEQEVIASLIATLEGDGLDVATTVDAFASFKAADAGHQDYYERNNRIPPCHVYTKRF